MGSSTIDQMKYNGRGWFLVSLLVACLLESVGFISLAVHSRSLTNHMAFFASFSATLVAPTLLIILNVTTFSRIIARGHNPTKPSSRKLQLFCNGFNVIQTIVLVALGGSIYDICSYLSPKPIIGAEGAMDRLAHYERAIIVLSIAHIVSLGCLIASGTIISCYTIRNYYMRATREQILLIGVNISNALCLIRTAWKTSQYTLSTEEYVPLVDHGIPFWLMDAIPILLTLAITCSSLPDVLSLSRPNSPWGSVFVDEKFPLVLETVDLDAVDMTEEEQRRYT